MKEKSKEELKRFEALKNTIETAVPGTHLNILNTGINKGCYCFGLRDWLLVVTNSIDRVEIVIKAFYAGYKEGRC